MDPTSTSLLLKVLRHNGTPPIASTSFRWSLPRQEENGEWIAGDWTPAIRGKLVPCKQGYHLCRVIDLPNWVRNTDEIYVVEYDGQLIVHDDESRESKVVVKKARLVRRVEFSDNILHSWAADCAEHVLSLYEARYPDDTRPRKAIEAARAYVRGEIGKEVLHRAREEAWKARRSAAAYSAAYSAACSAAYAAAYAADADAAYSAAYAAAYAADAAAAAYSADARRKEIVWQSVALASLLNLPGYGVHPVNEVQTP